MYYKFIEVTEKSNKKIALILDSLLTSPTLKLSNYASMNDPNEMKFEFKIGSSSFFKEDWMRRNPGKTNRQFENWLSTIKLERPRSARTEFVLYRRNLFKIASLSTSHKSNLLWSHYAGRAHGICIVYRHSLLSNFEGRQWLAGRVLYRKVPPIIKIPEKNAVEEMKKVCFTKEKCWEYEKEYRIALVEGSAGPIYVPIQKLDILGVILGINASEPFRKMTAKICKENNYKLFEIRNYSKGYALPATEIRNPDERLMVAKF
jgi:hypothetical protein